jgi:hypothetical protein
MSFFQIFIFILSVSEYIHVMTHTITEQIQKKNEESRDYQR